MITGEEYRKVAAAILKPLEDAGLSRDEIAMLLGKRLVIAAEAFAKTRGRAETWGELERLMVAVQDNGNKDR